MTCLTLFEHERVDRPSSSNERQRLASPQEFTAEHFDRLRYYDELQAGDDDDLLIFNWRSRWMKARNRVGVVDLGGLTVEILPKIDRGHGESNDGEGRSSSRRNLLYMLSVATALPLREQDLASQEVRQAPLLEALKLMYARQLRKELLRGTHHQYVTRRENLFKLKGKLAFTDHLKHNAGHRERFFVEYEEFLADNWLNRIFKASCRRLLQTSRYLPTREALSHCLLMLDDVDDQAISLHHFDRVHLDRRSERFSKLLAFARLVLTDRTPTAMAGRSKHFSLLFNMEVLFESFITEFLRRHVLTIPGFQDCQLFAQRGEKPDYLIYHYTEEGGLGRGALELKPDIMITRQGSEDSRKLIIDTKWKRLSKDVSPRQGVTREDVHQMYAYANTYDAEHVVLLYPRPANAEPLRYAMTTGQGGKLRHLHICMADVSQDLETRCRFLAKDLADLVNDTLYRDHSWQQVSPITII